MLFNGCLAVYNVKGALLFRLFSTENIWSILLCQAATSAWVFSKALGLPALSERHVSGAFLFHYNTG